MKKLGIMLPHTERSQLAYNTIKHINHYVVNKNDIGPIIFSEEVTRNCVIPSCPILTLMDVWGFNDTAVSTSISTTQILLGAPGPKRKLFYVNDLEWLRLMRTAVMFHDLYNIYSHKDIKLIARSDNHAKILKNNFGVDVLDVMPEIDIEKIYGSIT